MILDPQQAANQALRIAKQRSVVTIDGDVLPLEADTICLHGDNPNSEEIAWAVRKALDEAAIEVRALGR